MAYPNQQFPGQQYPQPGPPYGRPPLQPAAWQQTYVRPPLTPQGGFQPAPYGFPPPAPYGAPPPWQPPPRKSSPLLVLALVVATGSLLTLLVLIFLDRSSPENIQPQYQNEQYEVPPATDEPPELFIPDTEKEAEEYVEDNPLYSVSLASPVRCEVQLEEGQKSDSEMETYLQSFMGCLTRVWGPALEQAGHVAHTPKVSVLPKGEEVQSGCGTQPAPAAFFCLKDQRIYLTQDIALVLTEDSSQARAVFQLVMAHEYGHAVQARAGILASARVLDYHAESDSRKLELSRRVEVQADAFAGMALNSLSQSMGITEQDRREILEILYELGDDQLRKRHNVDPVDEGDHGEGTNRRMWGERGLTSTDIGVGNSFVAPASEVK